MNKEINPAKSVLLLLQREYIRECKFEPAKEENGNPLLNEEGVQIQNAIHSNGLSFAEWLKSNDLLMNTSPIIRPDKIHKLTKL
jgi:hypothetical protein